MKRDRAAVIGWPVGHSLSPALFNYFSERMRRPLDYEAKAIEPRHLESEVLSAKNGSWTGWNVTIPHKVNIMPLMDDLDESAKIVGAVNVVRFRDGRAIGYNTDAHGFLAPIRQLPCLGLKGCRAVVFGAGGAARAVCCALHGRIVDVVVINRTLDHARPLERDFDVHAASGDLAAKWVAVADIVVNATSLGMDGKTSPVPAGARFKKDALAYDLVYQPVETPFLRQAREQGVRILGGLAMLVGQAAETWRIWFNEEIPVHGADAAKLFLEDHLKGALK